MTDINHIIEPERQGLWIAVTFILALVALLLALIGLHRAKDLTYITQAEVMLLNKNIEGAKPAGNAPAKPAEPAQTEKK